jgi:hypothetical protein
LLVGRYPSAWTIPHTLGTFHGTNESCLLQQAVATHPATKQRAFYQDLDAGKKTPSVFFPLKRIKSRLPSAGWFNAGHSFLIKIR